MALTEHTVTVGSWLEDGQINVKRSTFVLRDGVRIAEQIHRHVLAPGDDTTLEDARVQAVASLLWAPEVIQAYRDQQARNRLASS